MLTNARHWLTLCDKSNVSIDDYDRVSRGGPTLTPFLPAEFQEGATYGH